MGRRRNAAFSLLELLVVIGVIAVLIGLLLPALFKARKASDRTQCLSNLHQIAAAYQAYLQEHQLRVMRVGVAAARGHAREVGRVRRCLQCPTGAARLTPY
jgi:prepilin-type N-terminal cleavage/methylation domain-containing protein